MFGMSLNEFLDITPVEFYGAQVSKSEYDAEREKLNFVAISNTLRLVCWHLVNIQIPLRKDKVRDPKRLIKFAWDEDTSRPQTLKQMKNTMKVIAGWFKGKKKKQK